MAAKLLFNISQQNFELIRDRIALIIKEELDNQASAGRQNNSELTGSVFIERYTPANEGEGTVICVNTDSCEYADQTPISQSNETRFFVDITSDKKASPTADGYELSGKKNARIAGLIRAILQNPVYDRLQFSNGIIERRSVKNIRFARVNDEQDAYYTRMSRVEVLVKMNEPVTGITPGIPEGYDTNIKIESTNEGFKLTYNT